MNTKTKLPKITYSRKWFNPLFFILEDIIKNKPKIKRVLIYGGKSSSKTASVSQLLAKRGLENRENSILFRKESTRVATTIKKSFQLGIDTTRLTQGWKTLDREFRSITGGQVVLTGLDSEDKAKGVEGYNYVLFDELDQARDNFDAIFIDIPRLTHGEGDDKIASVLAMCDTVLIPIKSGELDNLSTIGFLNMIKNIEVYKKEKGYNYHYMAFLSMVGKRPSDDTDAREFMADLKIPTFQNELRDVRALSKPYTYESLLEKGKEERSRFEPFFEEFIDKLKF